MYRLILFWLIFIPYLCEAQTSNFEKKPPSILIYSTGEQYLQPFIENELRELNNVERDTFFFRKVNSLNTIIALNKYLGTVRDEVEDHKSFEQVFATTYSNPEKIERDKITDILIDYDYLLQVNTISLGEQIEFQFKLFETNESDTTTQKIETRSLKREYAGIEDLFINITSVGYKDDLRNGIKRLFPLSNHRPIVKLKVQNEIVKAGDTLVVPLGSSILLDGRLSGDYDTKSIEYVWRNRPIKGKTIQSTNRVQFDNEGSQSQDSVQLVHVGQLGEYHIGLKIFDGIRYSEEIEFVLRTYDSPKIEFNRDLINNCVRYKNIFGSSRSDTAWSNNTLRCKPRVDYNLSKEQQNSILLSSAPLENKLFLSDDFDRNRSKVFHKYLDSDSSSSEIRIGSRFREGRKNWREETNYLYWVSPNGFLSKEYEITNRLVNRHTFNLSFNYRGVWIITDEPIEPDFANQTPIPLDTVAIDDSLSLITYTYESQESSKNTVYTSVFPSLSLGAYLSKNFEFELIIPIPVPYLSGFETANYKNLLSFRTIPQVGTELKSHFYSRHNTAYLNNSYVGLSFYSYKGIGNSSVNTLGIQVGHDLVISVRDRSQVQFNWQLGYSRFLNFHLRKSHIFRLQMGIAINLF